MIDPQLETQLRLLTLQVESWKKLHDLITYGLDKAKPIISSEQERQFTEIRSHLLQETEHIFTELNVLELSGKPPSNSRRSARGSRVRGLDSGGRGRAGHPATGIDPSSASRTSAFASFVLLEEGAPPGGTFSK
jgi:hypothetical protein